MTTEPADVAALQAEVAELREVVARLQARFDAAPAAPTPPPAPSDGASSRRDLLRLAGGVAAGAAGGLLVSAAPAAAASADSLTVGAQHTPDPGTSPTSGIDYTGSGPYFGAAPHAVFSVTDNLGFNGISAAVVGAGINNAAIGVAGFGPIYDVFAAGSGITGRVPFMNQGPPTSDPWLAGDVILDAHGNLFACVTSGTPGVWRKLAGPAAAGAFHAISPQRVYDSRNAEGPVGDGQERVVSVAVSTGGGPVVPAGATAVAITLTVTNTQGAGGFLAVRPAGTGYAGTSSINWFGPNQNLAATVISQLGGNRQLVVRGGFMPADFLIDVTGYYA
jgi:hypothetical protein